MADDAHARVQEAERLVREAQRVAEEAAAAAGGEVPPGGWQAPGAEPGGAFPDLSALTALVESLRGAVPPELARQVADALRELLIALRAVLDWYIARLEPAPPEPPADVQDIPVE